MAERPAPDSTTEDGITMTRVFDAPPERVWDEWTEPERFADWFGGRDGEVPLSTVSMDVRPGGSWRLTMFAGDERREIHWKGEYREVVEPRRLVFTVSDQPGEDAYELVTVVLTDLGDGRTEMLFEQRGQLPREVYERAREGWSGFFDRIDERLRGS
ncbi:MAG TPA: SRPBCC domain-containing protein [Gaiellaceae bacterium]